MLSSHEPATTEIYSLSLHDALPILAIRRKSDPLSVRGKSRECIARRIHRQSPRVRSIFICHPDASGVTEGDLTAVIVRLPRHADHFGPGGGRQNDAEHEKSTPAQKSHDHLHPS